MKSYLSSSSLASYNSNAPKSPSAGTMPELTQNTSMVHSVSSTALLSQGAPWHSDLVAPPQTHHHARSHSTPALMGSISSPNLLTLHESQSTSETHRHSPHHASALPSHSYSTSRASFIYDYILSLFKEISLFFFLVHPFREKRKRSGTLKKTAKQKTQNSAEFSSSSLPLPSSKRRRAVSNLFHSNVQRTKDLDAMFSMRSILAGVIFMLIFVLLPMALHFYNTNLFTLVTFPLRVQVLFFKLLCKMDVSRLLLGCFLRFFTSFAPTIDDNVWHHDIPGTIRIHASRTHQPPPEFSSHLNDAEHAKQWSAFLIHSEETAPQPMKLEHQLFFRDLDMDYIVIGASSDPHGIYGWIHSTSVTLHNDDFYPESESNYNADLLQLHMDWRRDELGLHRSLPTVSPHDDFTYLMTWSDLFMSLKGSLSILFLLSLNMFVSFWMMRFMRRNWKKSRKVGSYKIIAPTSLQCDQLRAAPHSQSNASLDVPAHHGRSFSLDSFLARNGGSSGALDQYALEPISPTPQVEASSPGGNAHSIGAGPSHHNDTSDPWQFPDSSISRRRLEHHNTSSSSSLTSSPQYQQQHHHHLASPSHQLHHSSSFDGLSPSTLLPKNNLTSHASLSTLDAHYASLSEMSLTPDNNPSSHSMRRPVPTLILPPKRQKGLWHYLHLAMRYYLGNIYLGFFGLLHIVPVLFCMNDYSLYSARVILVFTGVVYVSTAVLSGLYCNESKNHRNILHALRWISTVCFFIYCQFEVRQMYLHIMVDSGHGFSEAAIVEGTLGIPVWIYGSVVTLATGILYVVYLRYSCAQMERFAWAHSDAPMFSPLLGL